MKGINYHMHKVRTFPLLVTALRVALARLERGEQEDAIVALKHALMNASFKEEDSQWPVN